jgi:predicted lipoprotein
MNGRRRFMLQSCAAFALGSLPLAAACGRKRPSSREDVLASIASELAVPAMRVLSELDAQLARALDALPAAPRAADLSPAREALRQALLGWERAYTFRSGPFVESNAFLRAKFWPVRKSSFEALLLGTDPIDAARVGALGVDVKGLYALERLLWAPRADAPGEPLFSARPERARALANALAADVQKHDQAAAQLLGDGSAFARRFAAAGQASIVLLVNQLIESVEAVVNDRLERALGLHQNRRLKPGELLGDFSGLSSELVCTTLRQVRALYLGPANDGLGVLVKQIAPEIDAHLRDALQGAVAAAEALGAPLEQVVVHDATKLEHARDQARALERAFKAELTSVLGVTLSIAAGDGD